MEILKITTANYEVIYTGSVFTFKQQDLELSVEEFKIILAFYNDDKEGGIETEVVDNETLKIKLFNYNNSLGSGISEPLQIGMINNKTIYLDLMVYAFNKDSSKNIHYTFFKEL